MKQKRLFTIALCLCLLLSLAACGTPEPSTSTVTNKFDIPPFPEDDMDDPDYPYVCNYNTNLYHLTSCPDVLAQENKIFTYYKSEENAKQKGYTPCEKCLP
uniref:Ada DNA repair metal-binding domain-containing protein n=1 Tax=uncultured Bacillota bacterium TaxID=344338 RepID=A0A650EN03_9FIRM|nr:hypothetical protein Firmicute1046_1090 [uncultured Firmicutes bacterium]